MRPGRGRRADQAPPWSRRQMLALLVGAAVAAVVLLAGGFLAVVYTLRPPRPAAASGTRPAAAGPTEATAGPVTAGGATGGPAAAGDSVASAPMAAVGDAVSHPGPVSTLDPGLPLVLPPATGAGPAGVPAGFPPTPAGALAQLAAIDVAAVQSGSLAGARAVLAGWAAPGGPTAASWSTVAALAALLDAAGLSGAGSPQLTLVLTPLMGQIKGTVGASYVVPCIDFELDVTLAQTARGATADCQRMIWSGGRWLIGAGPEPAPAPAVWPDTDAAIHAGYRDLRHG